MARRTITIDELKRQVFQSNHYGKFIILSEEDRDPTTPHARRVKIRFLNTGHERVVQLGNALNGNVRDSGFPDPTTPRPNNRSSSVDFNTLWPTTHSGFARIIRDYGYQYPGRKGHMVRVVFINTGNEKDVLYTNLQAGRIGDEVPTINCLPVAHYEEMSERILRTKWVNMMGRCYNTKNPVYAFYGAAGVKVCERWHDYDNYVVDLKAMLGFNCFFLYPNSYHLDKDYLQLTKPKYTHIYSPETCVWLEAQSNSMLVNVNPTEYNGVTYNNNGFFAYIYNGNYCNLLKYGPFADVESAARFFYMQPHHPEILNKLPQAKLPEPGPIVFKEMRPMYKVFKDPK